MKGSGGSSYLPLAQRMIILGEMGRAYLENHTDLSDQGAQSMEMEKANLECLSGNGKSDGNTKIIPGKPQDLSV